MRKGLMRWYVDLIAYRRYITKNTQVCKWLGHEKHACGGMCPAFSPPVMPDSQVKQDSMGRAGHCHILPKNIGSWPPQLTHHCMHAYPTKDVGWPLIRRDSSFDVKSNWCRLLRWHAPEHVPPRFLCATPMLHCVLPKKLGEAGLASLYSALNMLDSSLMPLMVWYNAKNRHYVLSIVSWRILLILDHSRHVHFVKTSPAMLGNQTHPVGYLPLLNRGSIYVSSPMSVPKMWESIGNGHSMLLSASPTVASCCNLLWAGSFGPAWSSWCGSSRVVLEWNASACQHQTVAVRSTIIWGRC